MPFPIGPLVPVPPTNTVTKNLYQDQIGAKLADDFRVNGREARELVSVWQDQTYTPEQAALLKNAVLESTSNFDRGASRILGDFVFNKLPTLTQGVGGGIPSTSARLAWTPPTMHVDGTPANDLAGYEVWYGTAPGDYTDSVPVNDRAATSAQVDNLAHGTTYYFAVRALATNGTKSAFSNEVFKTVP